MGFDDAHLVIAGDRRVVCRQGDLQHAENHMLLLGRKTSLERVAAFLLEMDGRVSAAGVMALPMSRRDIADYRSGSDVYLPIALISTSKMSAVDQPNIKTPFMAVIGPSRRNFASGVTSP